MANHLTPRRLVLIIISGFPLLLALALTDPGIERSTAAPDPFASPVQVCRDPQFYTVEYVDGRDWDPDLRRFVTWQVYMRGRSDGRMYSVMTWWSHYVPGDVIRLCDGEQFPWGEWQRTYLPLLRK